MADYWLKLYIEVLDDAKMALLSDHLWRRFFEFCLIAKRYAKDGLLPPAPEIAWSLRRDAEEIETDLAALAAENLQLLIRDHEHYIVKNFAKRQARSTDAERKRNQRDRDRKQQYGGDVTNRDGNGSQRVRQNRADIDTESETEADADTSPGGPEDEDAKAAAATDKQIAALSAEDRAWLDKLVAAFGEKFSNPVQVKTALAIRAEFGETRGWEAILHYAGKSYPIGAAVVRALKALPNWKDYKPYPQSSGRTRQQRSSPVRDLQPRKPYNIDTALQMGMTNAQIRQKMGELGYTPEEITQQLRAYL
ncbi:MAG TPA: hypothetical protein VFF68_10110 [Anaerolineaceae bacterium]|nr:hypothetical protein [Anaerolineaceae bacterium]